MCHNRNDSVTVAMHWLPDVVERFTLGDVTKRQEIFVRFA